MTNLNEIMQDSESEDFSDIDENIFIRFFCCIY